MKRFAPTIPLALVLALGGFLAVAAAAPEMLPGAAGLTPREAIARTIIRLDLTDAQKREVALVLRGHKDAARAAFERVRDAVRAFDTVVTSDTADEAAVRQAFRVLAAAGEEAVVVKGRIMAEIGRKLTPEQRRMLHDGRDVVAETVRVRVETARSLLEEWINTHAPSAG